MPARYETTRRGAKVGGQTIYLEVGKDDDGTTRSVFVDFGKTGTDARAWSQVFFMAVSIGLQHGVPIKKYVKLMRGTKFPPHGIVTVNGKVDTKVKFASSPLDYIAKHLEESCE